MGTTELIIVFSALMALISLVSIGIDWIGKPLKHRRFIPRLYRFDDEKLPVDEFGRTSFNVPTPMSAAVATAPSGPPPAAGPAVTPWLTPAPGSADPGAAGQRAPVVVAELTPPAARRSGRGSHSAFTDNLRGPARSAQPDRGGVAVAAGAASTPSAWRPGLPLDATVGDRKPNLATKAERFWKATGHSLPATSHFDDEARARMADGKAPRRRNPRTGRDETMQLTGLRRASQRDDVRMRWPDDSVDPWNAG